MLQLEDFLLPHRLWLARGRGTGTATAIICVGAAQVEAWLEGVRRTATAAGSCWTCFRSQECFAPCVPDQQKKPFDTTCGKSLVLLGTRSRSVRLAVNWDWLPADLSPARAHFDIWTHRFSRVFGSSAASHGARERKRTHKQSNSLLIEHCHSQPNQVHASPASAHRAHKANSCCPSSSTRSCMTNEVFKLIVVFNALRF